MRIQDHPMGQWTTPAHHTHYLGDPSSDAQIGWSSPVQSRLNPSYTPTHLFAKKPVRKGKQSAKGQFSTSMLVSQSVQVVQKCRPKPLKHVQFSPLE